jgi:hypothetical protein
MAKMPSSRATYESAHGATRKITAAQKLAELVCERIAAFRGVGLAARFWSTEEWKGTFSRQKQRADVLLKLYDAEAIMRAFRANPRVRSLGASFFHEDVRGQQQQLQRERDRALNAPPIETQSTTAAPRIGVRPGRSARAKLNRVDGSQQERCGGDSPREESE